MANEFDEEQGRVRDCRWYRQARFGRGRVLLLGRAAYRVDPVTGQGMTLALSGALHLARLLGDRRPKHWGKAELIDTHGAWLDHEFTAAHRHACAFYRELRQGPRESR